ncbi:hypothetical protein DDD64_01815 [Actinotignum sanguinis]|nr:BspA family leucine-rich repeat surface protein [Actinotignum sanguinis]RTE51357.1 hypothetical protein DDD64_01815 [Actinotignum sanguinis]
MERAASVPVGPNLTATWDATTKTLTVAGYGELNRDQWMDLKKQHCNTGGEAEPKRIVFTPETNKQISFPQNSTTLFAGCHSAEIDFPKFGIDTSGVTVMASMFAGLDIANPDVSNWDTGNVISMNGMFSRTKKANPDVSRWNTSKVQYLSRMFEAAEVANPDVSGWDTQQVVSTERMFRNAVSADPDTSKWDLRNIQSIAEMFEGAVSVSFIDITEWPLDRFVHKYRSWKKAFFTRGKTTVRFFEEPEHKPIWNLQGDILFIFDDESPYYIYEEINGEEVPAELYHCKFKNSAWICGSQLVTGSHADALIVHLAEYRPGGANYIVRPEPFIAASADPIFINVGDPLPQLTYRTNPGAGSFEDSR